MAPKITGFGQAQKTRPDDLGAKVNLKNLEELY
jgi:hypothetical protein